MVRIVDLDQKYQFRILMHPLRQEMVHILRLAGRPLSANALAKRMRLSPSAAQGHLMKLVELGIVVMSPQPNGKQVLYSLDDVEIRLHLGRKDAFQGEREALAANLVDGTFRGVMNATLAHPEEELGDYSLLLFGALHLDKRERTELEALVRSYLRTHGAPSPEKEEHWEYVLMANRDVEER